MIKFLILTAAAFGTPVLAESASSESSDGPIARSGWDTGISAGVEYQEGDFGTGQRIATRANPVSAFANKGRFRFSATLPFLRVDAPGNVIGGGGGLLGLPIIVDPTQPATRERREGLGDLRLNTSYTIPAGRAAIALWKQVKVPTASAAKGLGTGKADYSFGGELAVSAGRIVPFANLGYTLAGDPDGYDLRNSLSARAGANLRITDSVAVRGSYNYAQSPNPGIKAEQTLSTALQANLTQSLSLGVYGSTGLSTNAPDFGAGVQIGLRL